MTDRPERPDHPDHPDHPSPHRVDGLSLTRAGSVVEGGPRPPRLWHGLADPHGALPPLGEGRARREDPEVLSGAWRLDVEG